VAEELKSVASLGGGPSEAGLGWLRERSLGHKMQLLQTAWSNNSSSHLSRSLRSSEQKKLRHCRRGFFFGVSRERRHPSL